MAESTPVIVGAGISGTGNAGELAYFSTNAVVTGASGILVTAAAGASTLSFGTTPPAGAALNIDGATYGFEGIAGRRASMTLDDVRTPNRGITLIRYSASDGDGNKHVSYRGKKAGGTIGAPSATPIGAIVNLTAHGTEDGVTYFGGAEVILVAGATWTALDHFTYVRFLITPSGSIAEAPYWDMLPDLTPVNANQVSIGSAGLPVLHVTANDLTLTQSVADTSVLTSTGYSVTGAGTTSAISLTGTFNTSGVVTAIFVNITNTASGVGSKVLDLQVSSGSVFNVQTNGTVSASGSFVPGQTASFVWSTRSRMTSPADGQINWTTNNSATGVGFDFGTDAVLKLRTRAQTGYATLDLLGLKSSGAAGASGTSTPGTGTVTVVNGIVTAIT